MTGARCLGGAAKAGEAREASTVASATQAVSVFSLNNLQQCIALAAQHSLLRGCEERHGARMEAMRNFAMITDV